VLLFFTDIFNVLLIAFQLEFIVLTDNRYNLLTFGFIIYI
jgi:hypothetical protein